MNTLTAFVEKLICRSWKIVLSAISMDLNRAPLLDKQHEHHTGVQKETAEDNQCLPSLVCTSLSQHFF